MTVAVAPKTSAIGLPGRRRPASSPVIVICLTFLGIVVVLALFGDVLAPQNPSAQNLANAQAPPSWQHWLGTDALGRDVFSRMLVGTRTAVVGPLIITVLSMIIGNLLGLIAGYRKGIIDSIMMRWVDLMIALPSLLVIIVVAAVVGGGYWIAVLMLVVLTVPFDARIMRGAVLEQAPRPYIEAAKVLGVSEFRILIHHIWPNVAGVALANAVLVFATSLLALSGLSFLGLGAAPGTPDWGLMLAENQPMIFVNAVATIAPGIAIVLTATSVNLVGDWVFEKISRRGAQR